MRVDAEAWQNARVALPKCTDKEISRVLYHTSAVKLERFLIDTPKKNGKYKKK